MSNYRFILDKPEETCYNRQLNTIRPYFYEYVITKNWKMKITKDDKVLDDTKIEICRMYLVLNKIDTNYFGRKLIHSKFDIEAKFNKDKQEWQLCFPELDVEYLKGPFTLDSNIEIEIGLIDFSDPKDFSNSGFYVQLKIPNLTSYEHGPEYHYTNILDKTSTAINVESSLGILKKSYKLFPVSDWKESIKIQDYLKKFIKVPFTIEIFNHIYYCVLEKSDQEEIEKVIREKIESELKHKFISLFFPKNN